MSCVPHGAMKGNRLTIDELPDDVLLDVFECHMNHYILGEAWPPLVHVCRRWRSLVFASPRRLRLQLVCTNGTPVRKMLNIWPDWPIVVKIWNSYHSILEMDDILAALEHNDRVCEVQLQNFEASDVEKVLSAIQKPFPELTHLTLHWVGQESSIFPESFLAPRLQKLQLMGGVPSPALQKLLLSPTDIVTLYLGYLSYSAYISPEEFATCLSVLTRLKHLAFEHVSPPFLPDLGNRHAHPPTRIVVPNLTELSFQGVSKYLEDLVARIDAPLFNIISIQFFDEPVSDAVQIVQFIRRTPAFNASKEIKLEISDRWLTFRISSLMQVGNPSSPDSPHVDRLYIFENRSSLFLAQGQDEENPRWLEFFRPYVAVKNLYISSGLVPRIVSVLRDLVDERVTKVLPFLRNIFVQDLQESSEPVQEAIRQLVTARQLSGRPVIVHRWVLEHVSGVNTIIRNLTPLP